MKPVQIVGIALGGVVGGFLIFFITAEMLTEPGGTEGLLMVVAWLALPVLLTILAWLRPTVAYPILVGMVALVLIAAAVSIPLARQTWEFENTHGPINLMVLLGALMPLIALGRSMPTRAGWLLLITIVGSLVLQGISLLIAGQASVVLVFLVLMPPFVAAAILFLLAGRQDPSPTIVPAEPNPTTLRP